MPGCVCVRACVQFFHLIRLLQRLDWSDQFSTQYLECVCVRMWRIDVHYHCKEDVDASLII